MTTVIHSARLVDDGEVTDDAWVAFADGVVLHAGTGDEWRALPAGDGLAGDLRSAWAQAQRRLGVA